MNTEHTPNMYTRTITKTVSVRLEYLEIHHYVVRCRTQKQPVTCDTLYTEPLIHATTLCPEHESLVQTSVCVNMIASPVERKQTFSREQLMILHASGIQY